MKKLTKFIYRVKAINSEGKPGTFLAEASAPIDETARRKIIAGELKQGGAVRNIIPTTDRSSRVGDWAKRSYAA